MLFIWNWLQEVHSYHKLESDHYLKVMESDELTSHSQWAFSFTSFLLYFTLLSPYQQQWCISLQRRCLKHLTACWGNDSMFLNIDKTKEIFVDLRKSHSAHSPLHISGSTIGRVVNIKFLVTEFTLLRTSPGALTAQLLPRKQNYGSTSYDSWEVWEVFLPPSSPWFTEAS